MEKILENKIKNKLKFIKTVEQRQIFIGWKLYVTSDSIRSTGFVQSTPAHMNYLLYQLITWSFSVGSKSVINL